MCDFARWQADSVRLNEDLDDLESRRVLRTAVGKLPEVVLVFADAIDLEPHTSHCHSDIPKLRASRATSNVHPPGL